MPNFTKLRQQTNHFLPVARLGLVAALLAAGGLAPTTTRAAGPLAHAAPPAAASLPPALRVPPRRAASNGARQLTVVPTVTSFSPVSGAAGSTVVITGTDFVGLTGVTVGGVSASYTYSATQLTAIVPAGATTGVIAITSGVGTGSSASVFTVTSGTNYSMSNTAVTTYSGTLYDSGGASGSYANNERYTKVISPGSAGAKVRLSFFSFDTEAGYDNLKIYDGPNDSYPLFGTYSGTNSPGTVTASNTNATGQLTLAFSSSSSGTAAGFGATISYTSGVMGTTFSVTGRNPASNATGVATSTPVGVTFSDVPTAASAANIRVFGGQAGGRRSLGAATVSGTTATLPVAGNAFRPGETVQVTVPATVLSTAGATAVPYAYQFTTATTPSSGRIGTKQADYTTGTKPADLGLGDVTGDGLPDLVVSNGSDNTISVLAGRGNGTFGARVNYPAGVAPYIIVLGDVNGDGRLDVLTTSQTGAAVTVLLATASGGLAAPSSYATFGTSSGAVLADFNLDGWLDIAATDGGSATVPGASVSVFLNNGNGTFGARSSYTTGSRPIAVGAGDVNGDGRPDLVTSNQTANTVSVLLGTGTGGFSAKTDYAVGIAPFIVTLGDLDNDADLDVVTCNQSANTVTVLRNAGSGTFTGRVDYTSGSSPQDVDLGDMNGDGRLDIVTADFTNNTVSILLNTSAGSFTKASYPSVNGPVSTALADIDGDGRLDLTALNTTSQVISTFLDLPLPTITSFLPGSGPVGTSVTITGTFLTGATQLLLNGLSISSFAVNAAGTTLTFTVPAGATSGLLSVTTPAGTVTSATAFTVTAPQLAVSQGGTAYPTGGTAYAFGNQVLNTPSAAASFTLTNAGTAPLTLTSVTTTGNFALSGAAPTTVPAGGSAAVGVAFTPTVIGSQTGTLRLVSSLGTYVVNLTGTGIYPVPTSTGLTPASGPVGTVVTVTGSGFTTSGTTVTLNGLALAGVAVGNGGTTLTFTVPAGATAGPVVVTTPGGTVTAGSFCVQYTPGANDASRCGAGSLTLTATGAPANGTYAWYTQATGGTPLAGASGATYSPTLAATTTFYVAIGTGAGNTACEGPRQAVTATINSLPVVTIAASSSLDLCGSSSVTLTASGADSYQWSTGQTTASITVSSAGSYSVTGLSAAGCAATSAATIVTVTPLPAAPAVTPASTCGPGSVTLGATGAPAGGSYAWYLAATGGSAIAGATGASYTTPSLNSTTTYYVSALTAAGCEGPRSAVVASVNAVPVATVAASGALTFCQGGSVVLTASGGDTYQWSTGATTASLTVSASGSYSVVVTNASGCSATSASTAVTVNPLPAQPTITQAPAGVLTSSSSTGNQWYRNGTAIPGATNPSYVISTAAQLGSYTVVVTSAAGCSSSASAALSVVVTGTATSTQPTTLQLYPNPAQAGCTLETPALAGVSAGQLTLVNSLGQVVLVRTLALSAAGTHTQLDLHGLAAGVYLVRLQAGATLLTKHLVIE